MNVTDKGFLQGEEKWLTPEETEKKYICFDCGYEIYAGDKFIRDGGYIQCEECAKEELEERFHTA